MADSNSLEGVVRRPLSSQIRPQIYIYATRLSPKDSVTIVRTYIPRTTLVILFCVYSLLARPLRGHMPCPPLLLSQRRHRGFEAEVSPLPPRAMEDSLTPLVDSC